MLICRVRIVLIAAAAVSVLVFSSVMRAQTGPSSMMPSTMPTSMPSAQSAPPDSPRGTLKALVGAMQAGDSDKIKSLIATTTPTEEKMLNAMANMSVSQKKFRTAAETAYGDNAKKLIGDTAAGTAAGIAKIDAAPETINGDTATVDPTGQPGVPPLTLKKVDGQWRIPIGELARGVDQNAIQQRLDDLSFMSKMMDESADEVSKGMYKTPEDAGEAIKSKMMVAMMKRANSATQATTAPGGPATGAPGASAPPPAAPMEAPATAPSTPGA